MRKTCEKNANFQVNEADTLETLCFTLTPFKICDALRDLVAFVRLKKREKHPWRSVDLTLLHGCFSSFLNCTNATKSRNASHMSKKKLR